MDISGIVAMLVIYVPFIINFFLYKKANMSPWLSLLVFTGLGPSIVMSIAIYRIVKYKKVSQSEESKKLLQEKGLKTCKNCGAILKLDEKICKKCNTKAEDLTCCYCGSNKLKYYTKNKGLIDSSWKTCLSIIFFGNILFAVLGYDMPGWVLWGFVGMMVASLITAIVISIYISTAKKNKIVKCTKCNKEMLYSELVACDISIK